MKGIWGRGSGCGAICIGLAAVLTGCANTPTAPVEVLHTPPQNLERPVFQRRTAVIRLLNQAEAAFARGRFTLPAENNAYDLFRAALMLEPSNSQARAGLDAVLLAYVEHVRGVIAAGQLDTAQQLVARGLELFPQAPLLQDLQGEIEEARAAISKKPSASSRADVLEGEKILLPELELDARSDEVAEVLTALAQRVQETSESVMIFARSDSEGRWIYKTMQEAVSGYRVRGDIRISPVPAVVLMPPL